MERVRRVLLSMAAGAVVAAGCSGGAHVDARLDQPGAVQEGATLPKGGPTAGAMLPSATYERLGGNGPTALSGYRGKPLVVNVWASWCGPCLQEMPAFQQVHRELGSRVSFVGLDSQDDRATATTFAKRVGVTYDLLADPRAGFVASMNVVAMPTTLFVDANGKVLRSHAGALSAEQLRATLQELFRL